MVPSIESKAVTENQKALGRLLTERPIPAHGSTRPVHAGVEVPVTASGLY
jgi:hypothetical protein